MKSFLQILTESKNEKKEKAATATIAVFRRHNSKLQVLIGKRADDPSRLVLPGGHIDEEEGDMEGALRELREETGIHLHTLLRIGKRMFGPKEDALFAALVDHKVSTKAGDDIGSLKWVYVDKLPDLWMGHSDVVSKAVEFLYNAENNKVPDDLKKHLKNVLGDKKPRIRKGLLIVFEGIDGSGKSVSVENLENWLQSMGYDYIMTKWNSSKLMEDAIKKGKKRRMLSPLLYSLLHTADMVVRYENEVLPALSANKIVLCDRYVYTSMVRDKVRGIDVDYLKKVYSEFREPDIVFHCDAPIELAFSRIIKDKGLNYYSAGMDLNLSDNQEESAIKYSSLMLKEYNKILPKLGGYCRVDTKQSIGDCFDKIKKELSEKFGVGRYKKD